MTGLASILSGTQAVPALLLAPESPLAECGTKLRAAEVAGVHHATPYGVEWSNDLRLQAAVRQVEEAAADVIASFSAACCRTSS
jgi:hypothetical protein